ncbi:phosphoadenylyl-sulfate reductase [Pseudovibrio sp. SPO723]|uniref:phosphoadenylyl-sulfate reductase n=1 Tax=Nesiotobacter zosterae TaxID=392721 RepID=UPI0029C439D4|nr:phosphoadenylyl-sulfate reductase [Pseudovibrio sp. SPO723]MDX5592454.1 phosphoadenylyl-sulfate reductase [Pseudovibrio sp. SPO723]
MAQPNVAEAHGKEELLAVEAASYDRRFGGRGAKEILRIAINDLFKGQITLVSSFGADSSVLLHLVSEIDRDIPVVFVDTGKLFGETKRYRDELIEKLGLRNVVSVKPAPEDLAVYDPKGNLWLSDNDQCCHIRKVLPLKRALSDFDAWISGRKRHQSATRTSLPFFEVDEGRIKVNPLADWTATEILQYAKDHDLPPHPLVAEGYPSIGCMPCTDKVAPGEDPRSGRWRGMNKIECGIHLPSHGQQVDGSGI